MKAIKNMMRVMMCVLAIFTVTSCNHFLDEPNEDTILTEGTDYTKTENMKLPLLGAYSSFATRGWEDYLLIAVRGDDVNAGGLGDQQPYADTDLFVYNKDYWMYNSLWQNLYIDILNMESAIVEIGKYKEFASNPALADQYIAEVKVLRGYLLFTLSRVWGPVFITSSPDPSDLLVKDVSSKDEVMQHISDQMAEAIPMLPAVRPNERTDVPGGVTRFTALAVQALANLELKNYPAVATATSAIIASGKFSLHGDFYELFKTAGKLNSENLLELQYSDFGQGSGTQFNHLYAPFGPENWTPSVTGAGSGWGFYEPSLKWVKFMLTRNETVRLETSVLFTNRGIAKIKEDPAFATLPAWITNTTRDGDIINNFNRALFSSGKHYMPSNQLTPGRTDYGSNKNFQVIRYAEILLMHAEALTQGATGTGMTADQAVNAVRTRAGLGTITGVTNAQVMNEKFAELGMEWGTRYFDMIRMGTTNELSYDGRTFTAAKTFLPYPQIQRDILPVLGNQNQ